MMIRMIQQQVWNPLRNKNIDKMRNITNEFRLMKNIEITTAWLEHGIERVKSIEHRMFFDLDQQRTRYLKLILETVLELCRQSAFEERERLCIQIDNRCQDILREIEESPTKLSIEEIYPVVNIIQEKVKKRLEELYETSKPQLSLRLPIESYPNNNQIEIQIAVANQMGCSPAESLELIVQPDEIFFTIGTDEIRLDESLRGGTKKL
ncbi:MAG: hypothetical protein V2I97_15840 [Desulfococcaceae bacterium]|nr:hypothetical protein [Desulfococcaceae bacterium]